MTTETTMSGKGGAGVISPAREWICDTTTAADLWPFTTPTAPDLIGTPLGVHPDSGQLACYDPYTWFQTGRQRAAQLAILAANGVGKSALAKKLAVGLAAQGLPVVVPFDAKHEYAALVDTLGGQALTLDRNGGLDLLDPAGAIATARAEDAPDHVLAELTARRDRLVATVVGVHRGAPLAGWEETALATATSLAGPGATITDLPAVFTDRLDELAAALARPVERADELLEPLTLDVAALTAGQIGHTLSGATAQPWDVSRPVVVDTSRIPQIEKTLTAAVVVTCWTAAHSAIYLNRHHNPGVGVHAMIFDEIWRATREFPALAAQVGGLLRMDRHEGLVTIVVTHSWTDTEQPGGSNILARCAALALGGLQRAEADLIANAGLGLTHGELTEVRANTSAARKGRFIIKTSEAPGHLVQTVLTAREDELLDTNAQWTTTGPTTGTRRDLRSGPRKAAPPTPSTEPSVDFDEARAS
ncbi:MAG: hypothetical protein AAF962_18895 [Actinomycetota bacterium]